MVVLFINKYLYGYFWILIKLVFGNFVGIVIVFYVSIVNFIVFGEVFIGFFVFVYGVLSFFCVEVVW